MATIRQNEYNVSKQNIRNLSVKINLLNFAFQTVDSLEGNVVSGDYSVDADADIRRTANISMVVTDSSFDISANGKIWIDKYIQIYTGIDNLTTGTVTWTNIGIYLINNPNRIYDVSTNTLSFQALDLMAKLTGLRNGNVDGLTTVIPIGSSIRDVMISTLTQFTSFKKYVIEDNPQKVPYEIKMVRPFTVYDVLVKLRDISPNYEMFFDVNGVFHYQMIPSGIGDGIFVDNDVFDSVVTNVDVTTSFDSVKNSIEVWGRSHDPSYYIDAVTATGSVYAGTVAGLTAYPSNTIFGITIPSVVANPKIKINTLAELDVVNEDGTVASFSLGENKYYCIRTNADSTKFIYLGGQQIYGYAQDTNTNSPFYIGGTTGKILLVLSGGEYDVIPTDDLAKQRAEYELYLHDRIIDTITLGGVPVYWLDVNKKAEYINEKIGLVNSAWNPVTQVYDLPSQFIIKKINIGLEIDSKMTVTMSRFYPLYPIL